ncbi:MAG: hypothetical protein JO201_02025, partial [Verrucomicrobia bacterium]|nr:hypothetical protein [Verrucomicrobiota bacterium]
DFYRAHEWDLSIWGAFAFAADTGEFAHFTDAAAADPFTPDTDPSVTDVFTGFFGEPKLQNPNERINLGQVSKNELFARDNVFGGGADAKYFWSKYFGAGIEAVGLAAKTKFAGGSLATLTVRYPFGRFAPYAFGGVGFIDGGATLYQFYNEKNIVKGLVGPPGDRRDGFVSNEQEFLTTDPVKNHHLRALGQLGLGLEYRVTCHIGLMADFSWNFVFGQENHPDKLHTVIENGQAVTEFQGQPFAVTDIVNTAVEVVPGHNSNNQDFGMARFGVTFSY